MTHICVNFLYSFARACITFRQIELRSSRLDTFVAEEHSYLSVHFARLGSLVLLFLRLGPVRHLFQDRTDHGYRTVLDRQPPTLTARVNRVLAILYQSGQPVAQKMHTGLPYLKLLVLGKIIWIFCNELKRVTYYYFKFYHDLAH